jgi:hypothetical protein
VNIRFKEGLKKVYLANIGLFLPKKSHRDRERSMREKPKSKSSTGAPAKRRPIISALEYITILFEVSHQFVNSWKGKMSPYVNQKIPLVIIFDPRMNRSRRTATMTAFSAISE